MTTSWRMGWLAFLGLSSLVALTAAACDGDDEETTTSGPAQTVSQGPGGTGGTSVGTGAGATGGGGAGGSCTNTLPSEVMAPSLLSATGLYADIASKTVAPYVQEFEPQFLLWSDGAIKRRWVYLPECGIIDNSDEDIWDFPVGTRMWKQFELNGELMETRMIHRHGAGPLDFVFAAYEWNAMNTEADHVPSGVEDVKLTEHDIPDEVMCRRCHGGTPVRGGTPSRYLGFSAIQLSHSGPFVTIDSLVADGSLSNPPPMGGYTVPGTAVEQAALGLLHANCGNCHNDTPDGLISPMNMNMLLSTGDTTTAMTGVYTDLVNQPVTMFTGMTCTQRVAGMNVADSCVHFRMNERGDDMTPNFNQMPPLGTDLVDATGLLAIEAWIATIPP